ncbi:MAG: nucleotidyltransferase domain-containing protein [Candidatus Scalindua sp.]|nr:nucleotidyltransferase domain-containing protein [Candidatus Scalindua sp.]
MKGIKITVRGYRMKRFEQWKAKTETEKVLLERCRDAIFKVEPSAELILYGSRARGDSHEYSDYDLIILIDEEFSLEKENYICHQLCPIELEMGEVNTAFVYSRSKWNSSLYREMPFHKNVEKDGVIL